MGGYGSPAWHVLGAGAVGGLWAARLARAGVPLTVLMRDAQAVTRRRTEGLRLEDAGGVERVAVAAEATDAVGPPLQRLLVAVKTPQTLAALAPLRARLTADTALVLMQNGMGTADAVATAFPPVTVIPAVTQLGAWRRGPGHIVHAGPGATWLGGPEALGARLAAELAVAGLPVEWDADIRARQWAKLAVNAAINPPSALLDCRNGALVDAAEGRALIAALCAETARVLEAEGCPETADALAARVVAVARATAANVSSMCADVRAGRETEIEAITGYLLARAALHGLALPRHRQLYELIRLRTRGSRR